MLTMMTVSPEDLAKVCTRVSGHAMKILVHNAPASVIYDRLRKHVDIREVSAGLEEALDDSMPTIITGVKRLPNLEQAAFWKRFFELRFRNVLILSADGVFAGKEPGIHGWINNRVTHINLGE